LNPLAMSQMPSVASQAISGRVAMNDHTEANYLRTDGHRLCRLQPVDPGLRELQALVRLREDHVRARTAASNQLGALLDAYRPGPKAMFFKLASDIALAFLADYPTPRSATRLGEARLAAFCRRHAYRGGKPPAELLARLRAAPIPPTGLAPAVLAQLVTAQVQLLRTLQTTPSASWKPRSSSGSPSTHAPSS
jgi:hypothetical protein